MTKFRAILEYDGTSYHGWQLQKDIPTVQGALEAALERILNRPTRVHGAGRTDAGVHALGQVVHFETDWTNEAPALQRACNAFAQQPHIWKQLVQTGMQQDLSWVQSAKRYMDVYNTTLRKRNAAPV